MAKERLEDLGRLRVMVEDILDDDTFNIRMHHLNGCRPKDSFECFNALTEEQKEHFILDCVYGLDGIEETLYKMLEIARGDEEEGV